MVHLMIGVGVVVAAVALFAVVMWCFNRIMEMEGLEEGVERRMEERERNGERWCAGLPCGSNAMCYGCPANPTVGMGMTGCGTGWGMM